MTFIIFFHIPHLILKFEGCDISILPLHLVTNRVCNNTPSPWRFTLSSREKWENIISIFVVNSQEFSKSGKCCHLTKTLSPPLSFFLMSSICSDCTNSSASIDRSGGRGWDDVKGSAFLLSKEKWKTGWILVVSGNYNLYATTPILSKTSNGPQNRAASFWLVLPAKDYIW